MRTFEDLWRSAECPGEALEYIDFTGSDPVLPSPFKIGEAAAATIGATALAAAELWRLRSGRPQQAHVNTRTAAMAFRSERHLRIDGPPTLNRKLSRPCLCWKFCPWPAVKCCRAAQ